MDLELAWWWYRQVGCRIRGFRQTRHGKHGVFIDIIKDPVCIFNSNLPYIYPRAWMIAFGGLMSPS